MKSIYLQTKNDSPYAQWVNYRPLINITGREACQLSSETEAKLNFGKLPNEQYIFVRAKVMEPCENEKGGK